MSIKGVAENSEGKRPFERSRYIRDYRNKVPGCGRMNKCGSKYGLSSEPYRKCNEIAGTIKYRDFFTS
jgi:hypothetical protein